MGRSPWGLDEAVAARCSNAGLSLTAVPATVVVAPGAHFKGRVEVACEQGPQVLSTNEPALGLLLGADGGIAGEFDGMLSGWGRELRLNTGDRDSLDFVAASVSPGSVDAPPRATPPGEYDLVVAVVQNRWPDGGGPAEATYLWTAALRVRVAER